MEKFVEKFKEEMKQQMETKRESEKRELMLSPSQQMEATPIRKMTLYAGRQGAGKVIEAN